MATRSSGKTTRRRSSASLSPRTKKAIYTFPTHAQHIYAKVQKNALMEYANHSNRRGGKRQSREQVAHKVAWAAVKKAGYKREGKRWKKA